MPDSKAVDTRYVPYEPRRIQFEGLHDAAGHRLKIYAVVYGEGSLDRERFAPGIKIAIHQLAEPNPGNGRPGLGFVIQHQGRTGDYVVLCWWDQENELPTRVFVRDESSWRLAVNESFCVWDLEIMWFERSAYVDTILSVDIGSTDAYLGRTKA